MLFNIIITSISMVIVFIILVFLLWKISKYLSYNFAFLFLVASATFVLTISLILIMTEKNNMNFITTFIYPITTKYIISNYYYVQHYSEILNEKNIDAQKAIFDKNIVQKTKDKVYTFLIAVVYLFSLFIAHLLQSSQIYYSFSKLEFLLILGSGVSVVFIGVHHLNKNGSASNIISDKK